jgi:glycosyltransferase involved in cell wall biosynthesis
METIDISVIVTTKNEEKSIQNCLESIKQQTYRQEKIEIIVVDNNSTDKTKEISLRYTNKVYSYGPERSAQRNYGVQQASGKYIIYLDADMSLSPDVIAECVEKCEKEGVVALYIPERIIGDGFWIKVRDFERSFYNATCIDAVRFVRRDKFLAIGGFDETLTGPEDWDFNRRISAVVKSGITASVMYHNEGRFRFGNYLQKKKYYSNAFQRYVNKWGSDDIIVRKQLGLFYRVFGVFMEAGKWKRALVYPWFLAGVYYLKFFVGLCYILRVR